MIHSLTATILLGLPVRLPVRENGRITHLIDDKSRDGGWEPRDWDSERAKNIAAVEDAVNKGINYNAAIASSIGVCHVTVRECLKVLVANGKVEQYRIGLGKRSFYRPASS